MKDYTYHHKQIRSYKDGGTFIFEVRKNWHFSFKESHRFHESNMEAVNWALWICLSEL
jgi:hypothetical protein